MTVEELFNHFRAYFDVIVFFDKTENVQDSFYDHQNKNFEENRKFLSEYGEYEVDKWEFETWSNTIELEIHKNEEDEDQ